jgi:hypothetical protein
MKTDRGKRKVTLSAVAAALAVCASVALGLAAYALWAVSVKSEGNEVTVGLFTRVTVDAPETYAAGDVFTATFTAGISAADTNEYDFYLSDIYFYGDESDKTEWNVYLPDVWEWAFTGGEPPENWDGSVWRDFRAADRRLIGGIEKGGKATVALRIKEGANPDYVIGSLEFTGELRPHADFDAPSVSASLSCGEYGGQSELDYGTGDTLTVTFTPSIAGGDAGVYDLCAGGILFYGEGGTDFSEHLPDVWEYRAGGEWLDLTDAGMILLKDAQNGNQAVLQLRIKADADPAYLSGTLELTGELK